MRLSRLYNFYVTNNEFGFLIISLIKFEVIDLSIVCN